MARFVRYVKDFWKVFIRGENEDLQRQTVRVQEELARLRERRMASDKEREAAALNQARNAVHKIRELHDNLLSAEKAAAEFAAKLGEAAKNAIEAHAEMRQESCKKFFTQQKQQMFAEQIAPESDKNAPIACSNNQKKETTALELKTGRATDDKDIFAAMCADASDERGLGQPSFHLQEVTAEKNRDMYEDGTSSSEASKSMAANMDLGDEVPPEALAKMLEEARKQVHLEEKSHLDALSRNRAIYEKEIEGQEMEERACMQQDHH